MLVNLAIILIISMAARDEREGQLLASALSMVERVPRSIIALVRIATAIAE
ncbi:hypothetical protein [Amycolatopsis aidingensis]|uniref:hypothetical protein n=1 Tax=Amycolatopsis aidingensis TaxID=2842453 RepID=UPI001C0BE3FE|nr:hypothetical protein [Amycolatopsis aidingensis]